MFSQNVLSTPQRRPLELRLFGPAQLYWHPASGSKIDITGLMQPRALELLVFLATHPDGANRDLLIEAMWTGRTTRPADAINCTLSRLRRSIWNATNGNLSGIVTNGSCLDNRTKCVRYKLDSAHIAVDFWDFIEAVRSRRRAATDDDREVACRKIVDLACEGELAAYNDFDWIEPVRQAVRRDTMNSVGVLAALTVDREPRQTLELLETVLDLYPYNELLYQDILRLHAKLGEHRIIDLTMALLTRRLAHIGDSPSAETIRLARDLRRRAS